MIQLIKICSMILTDKDQKYQHLEKLIKTNILLMKKYYLVFKEAKFTYYPLGKLYKKKKKETQFKIKE